MTNISITPLSIYSISIHFCSFQSDSGGSTVENSTFKNVGGTIQQGISIGVIGEGTSDITLDNVTLVGSYQNSASTGVDIKNYSQNIKILNSTIEGWQAGIRGLSEGSLSNSIVDANYFKGISKDVIGVDSFYNNIVSNNIVGSIEPNRYFLTVYDNQDFAPSVFANNITNSDNQYRLVAGTGEIVARYSTQDNEKGEIKEYVTHVDADAATDLQSGMRYMLTGDRTLYIKP